MKFSIEISDDALHNAVEAQVGKVVAQFTDQLIQAKVSEIVDKKLARVGDADLQIALAAAASMQMDRVLGSSSGNTWSRDQKIRSILSDAAVMALKGMK